MESIAEIKIKTADQLDSSPVEWLIPNWIPKRGITLLCGDGGVGKSYLWVSLASALSKGNRTILNSEPQSEELKILCLSGEDSESVLRSRFESAYAKMQNVFVIAQDTEQPEITFSNGVLDNIVDTIKPRLLILDPLQSFIGSGVDMSRRNQMRSAMRPLQNLSARYDMPVVIVCHTNKRENAKSARDKFADSGDLWDIARSGIMVGFGSNKERYISLEKSNNANHLAEESILFDVEDNRLKSCGKVSMKYEDFVQERKANSNNEKAISKKSECEDEILEKLSPDEWTDSAALKSQLKESGYGERSIRYALSTLKTQKFIEPKKESNGKTYYRLKEESEPDVPNVR